MHDNEVCIFSGMAHRELAGEICDRLGVPLSPSLTRRFSNDNLYVQLQESVREKDVFVIQPLTVPCSDHLVELLLLLDAARSASASGPPRASVRATTSAGSSLGSPPVCCRVNTVAFGCSTR